MILPAYTDRKPARLGRGVQLSFWMLECRLDKCTSGLRGKPFSRTASRLALRVVECPRHHSQKPEKLPCESPGAIGHSDIVAIGFICRENTTR